MGDCAIIANRFAQLNIEVDKFIQYENEILRIYEEAYNNSEKINEEGKVTNAKSIKFKQGD